MLRFRIPRPVQLSRLLKRDGEEKRRRNRKMSSKYISVIYKFCISVIKYAAQVCVRFDILTAVLLKIKSSGMSHSIVALTCYLSPLTQ